jgi:putative transposase
LPAISTVHAVLDRHGLVQRRTRRRRTGGGTGLSTPTAPNALWCADYKGEFMLGNRRYCYPLTITDFASRYLLTCEALTTTQERFAFTVFEQTFKEFGLPAAIRTDNGVPFASAHALYGLSTLSVWWLRLGIQIERSKPGHPQDNGRHERMHLTLKKEATKPASANVLQQQARFDTFIAQYNPDRPHQALAMKVPADVYTRSPRVYHGLDDLTYPFHDQTIAVTQCGRICFNGRKVNLSRVFAGQAVGVTQVGERIWLVTFMQYDLGYFDDETCRLEPIANPFGPKVLPMSSAPSVRLVVARQRNVISGARSQCMRDQTLLSRLQAEDAGAPDRQRCGQCAAVSRRNGSPSANTLTVGAGREYASRHGGDTLTARVVDRREDSDPGERERPDGHGTTGPVGSRGRGVRRLRAVATGTA